MVTKREVMSAGQPAEGVYRFRIEKAEYIKDVSKKGNPYEMVKLSTSLFETTGTKRKPEGEVFKKPMSFEDSFWPGSTKLNSIFRTLLDRMPGEGVGIDDEVKFEDEILDLQGLECWGAIRHGEPDENERIYGEFISRFSKQPDGIKFTPRS